MSVSSDLQNLVNLLRQKERQTLDAARERLEALQRISSDFETLKKNPSDEAAKSRLPTDLNTESKYLGTIRDRTNDISRLLGIASGEIKAIQNSNKNNQKIMNDLDALNSIINEFKILLQYIQNKMNLIKTRVKIGSRLIKGKLNNADSLFAELTELRDERLEDERIIGVLRGQPGAKPRTQWQKVKNRLALDIKTRPGLSVYGAVSSIKPNELPRDLQLIAETIQLTLRFFEIFANYEISSEQKER